MPRRRLDTRTAVRSGLPVDATSANPHGAPPERVPPIRGMAGGRPGPRVKVHDPSVAHDPTREPGYSLKRCSFQGSASLW